MTDQDLPAGFEPLPHSIEPGAVAQAKKVLHDPVGVPVHHTTIDAEERHENPEPTSGLAPGYTWFCLGLAYCLIRIDRSLFEVFQAAKNKTLPVRTHRADQAISAVNGSNYELN